MVLGELSHLAPLQGLGRPAPPLRGCPLRGGAGSALRRCPPSAADAPGLHLHPRPHCSTAAGFGSCYPGRAPLFHVLAWGDGGSQVDVGMSTAKGRRGACVVRRVLGKASPHRGLEMGDVEQGDQHRRPPQMASHRDLCGGHSGGQGGKLAGAAGPHSHLFWVPGLGESCLGNGREPEQLQGQHGK